MQFDALPATARMPVLFVGHGSPMNAIEDSPYTQAWKTLGERLPRPAAVLCVSAHWMTRGVSLVHVGTQPRTIHDFGGFPPQLYAQQYPAPGAPDFAQAAIDLVRSTELQPDKSWGLDHGAWSVLIRMYPEAKIPVFQLSLDLTRTARAHYDLARELKPLREKGVLILGSGNLVHNLHAMMPGGKTYDWAEQFDISIARAMEQRNFEAVVNAELQRGIGHLAHPTTEHFLPLLYALGPADAADELTWFNASFDLASISMRSCILA